jgi:hypothetical protein
MRPTNRAARILSFATTGGVAAWLCVLLHTRKTLRQTKRCQQ